MNNLKFKNNLLFILLLISIASLTACTVGPDYNKVTFEFPENFKETADNKWKKADPKDDHDKGKWWEIFQDPVLNKLEEQLNISNQNIAAAMSQYDQAQALLGQSVSGYFPNVSGSGGATRQRSSATSVSPATESTGMNGTLSATWVPDLWGSVRRNVEASKAGAEASAAQLANVKLTAQASLAQYYFQILSADNDQKLLDDTTENYKKELEIVEQRKSAGTASESDYAQAATQYEQAQALALDNKITRAQYEHAMAVLLGNTPSEFYLEAKQAKLIPPDVPLVLPSELLERRPDVAQAERLVEQANAQIGVAIAAYFPNFNITANGGYSSSTFANLFNLPALFWSLGGNLTETLFDGGLRGAKVDAAKANYKALAAQYKQTVLSAFQNVEDNLAATRILKEEEEFQKNAAAHAQTVENLITHGYEVGTNTYSDVINAQTTSFTAQKTVNGISAKRMASTVNLIAALGGSWQKEEKK
ncbi:efflux transporter outer membrane subunit [Silvanigrella aquatica]|uniref:RND transporter n=1 Tax=Silvanigrella aquatica TaxID=1915309 RepID=A0A1L4D285_9BACT|nr:efflux transporter outer membrane subunit [Silvanigrella aquatica]APJ04308.1 hypothetical protein AXG55_10480 [Silvanigrella aquatica]